MLDDTWYQFFNFQAILSNPYLKHKNSPDSAYIYIYITSDAIHLQCFVQLQHSCFPACHGACCSCICSRTHSIAQFQACSRTAEEGIQDITMGHETSLTSGVTEVQSQTKPTSKKIWWMSWVFCKEYRCFFFETVGTGHVEVEHSKFVKVQYMFLLSTFFFYDHLIFFVPSIVSSLELLPKKQLAEALDSRPAAWRPRMVFCIICQSSLNINGNNHESSSTNIKNQKSWIIIKYHESSSSIMNHHQLSPIVINHQESWIINHHQVSWIIINYHQSSKIIKSQ